MPLLQLSLPLAIIALYVTEQTLENTLDVSEIRCGFKFVSFYNEVEDGEPIAINVRKLSEIVPAEIG